MKKKRNFLLPLLMAIVMMAMSPTKVWATANVTWSLGGAVDFDPAAGVWVGSSEEGGKQIESGHLYLCFTSPGSGDDMITQLTSLSSKSGLDGAGVDAMTTFLAENSQWNGYNANNPNFSANCYGQTGGEFGTPPAGQVSPSVVIIDGIDQDKAYDVVAIIFDTQEITADSKYVVIKGYGELDFYTESDNGLLEIGFASEWYEGDFDHGMSAPNNTVDGWHTVGFGVHTHTCSSYNADGIGVCTVCHSEVFEQPKQDSNDNYLIANTGNLYWFRDFVNTSVTAGGETTYPNLSACAKLTANIVVNDGEFDEDGNFTATGASDASTPRSWTPIGPDPYDDPYTGTFDGDGHTISGLYCNDSNESDFGLFRYCGNGATVKGVGIVNCYFNCGLGCIGAICYQNYGTIDGCYSTGTITSEYNYNAGLCIENYGTISNCYSTCSVYGPDGAFGICKANYETLKNCYFAGSLSSDKGNNSGICYSNKVSENSAGTVTNCYTTFDTAILDNQTASGAKVYCVETKNAEAFSKGEIAYKLNGSVDSNGTWTAGTGTLVWYQKLGDDGDDYPVLKKASDGSNTVYYGYDGCTLSYANAALSQTPGDHNFDSKTLCDQDQKHDVAGFYYYLCDKCGAKSEHTCVVIKDYAPDEGNDKNLELTVTTDGETTTYSASEAIALTDANQFANVNVAFSTPSTPTYTREMTTEWGTIVLPFEVSTQTDDYDLYKCETLLDNRLVMRILPANEALPAGYPAFVRKKTDAESITFTGTGNVVNTAPPSSENNGNTILLKGAYTTSQLNNGYASYIYFIYNDAFWNVNQLSDGQEVTILPFHAYIQEASSEEGPGNMNAKLMIVTMDDATSIGQIENGTLYMVNGKCYNLNGQRLSAPQKGLNIINGKKVMVK